MPLALENRVWRQRAIHLQEFYVPALKVIIYPFVFVHSFIHLLLNMDHVPGTILGMADTKMNDTGSLPRGVQHLVREWALQVSDVTVDEQCMHGEHGAQGAGKMESACVC